MNLGVDKKPFPPPPSPATIAASLAAVASSTDDKSLKNDENNMKRYKIETNLAEFNRNRPGFVDVDVDLTEIKNENEGNNFVEFKDARFYTDYHFLKLAAQLKEKTAAGGSSLSSMVAKTNEAIVKPVNVVEPLCKTVNEISTSSVKNTLNESLSPISASLWKLQREQYEDRIRYLEEQIKGFYEQLEIQTQINAELKKLLVASIGDDIQYKIERLINDKQRFEHELINNNKRLAQMSEELEQISIQCDLWRAKFLASKSLNDELQTWKTFLLLLDQEKNQLLRNIIAENEFNNHKLTIIFKNLNQYKQTIDKSSSMINDISHIKPKNNLKLINLINNLINDLLKMNGQSQQDLNIDTTQQQQQQSKALDTHDLVNSTTKSEYLAKQLLIQFAWLPYSNLNSIELIESLLNGLKLQKTKVIQRYDQFSDDNVMLTCCSKCKGNLKIV